MIILNASRVMCWFRKSRPDRDHAGNDLLLENGNFILLEDGVGTILLEQ